MRRVLLKTVTVFLSFLLTTLVVGHAQVVRALPCSETYSVGCSCGGASGSQTCHKKGQSPNGQGGPQCSWGAGSYCDACKCSAPQQSSQPQVQQQQQSGCSNRSCPGNECNDGTKYGADPCTPQASCADRDREACASHGGVKGGSAQASSQQPVGGSCPAGSSNGCAGRNPGDVFHIAGTCLKCVKIGNSCGRDEVSCPADLSKVPAVTTGESGYGQLPDPIPVTGDASTCNKNSFPGCVGEGGGYMLVSDNSSGVCQQCVMAGNGACARTYVMCPGAKRVAQSGQCAAGSADGCYGKKPGDTITVGKETLTCIRSGSSGPCQRTYGTVPVKTDEPQKSSQPAASQAVQIPANSGNKVDYCWKNNMVYVGGCVDKCLPQTKTAIEWTTAICGYTEQQQQDIANKLKGKDRQAELDALAQKKKEVEQAVSTQNTLDTYDTGPQAGKNCKNRGGTLLDCGDSGKVCFGDTEVTQGQKDAECAKLKDRQDKAKGTGKNWLDVLMTSGGDGQQCRQGKDSDCVSGICKYVPSPAAERGWYCTSYQAAKDAAAADVKSRCQSPSVLGTCTGTQNSRFYVPQSVCIPPGSNLDNACASLVKRMQAAEDKGLNSFDWQKVMLKAGDKCSDKDLCETGICDVAMSGTEKTCLTQAQYDLKNKTKPAPVGTDLTGGYECVRDDQCRSGRCDKSNTTWLTPDNVPIGKCDYVLPGNGEAKKDLGDVCAGGTECKSGFCMFRKPMRSAGSRTCVAFSDLYNVGEGCSSPSQCKSGSCTSGKCDPIAGVSNDMMDASRVILSGAVCNIYSGCLCVTPSGKTIKVNWSDKCYTDDQSFALKDATNVALGGACIKDGNCAEQLKCADKGGNRVQAGVVGTCQTKTTSDVCSESGRFKTESDCAADFKVAISSGNAECRQGADQCWTINQLVLEAGKTCLYERCQCKTKLEGAGEKLTFGWVKQNEQCPQAKQPPACGMDYSSSGACETARAALPAPQSTSCDKYSAQGTDCWKIKNTPPPLPDLCKLTGYSCPWFSNCETVDATHLRCSGWFGAGGQVRVINYGDTCGESTCMCSSRSIKKNDVCAPTQSECPAPKVIFGNRCLESLPSPQKVNDSCSQEKGAPACPVGSQCLKKAGAQFGTCVSLSATAAEFAIGDECPDVGQECAAGEPSICQHSEAGNDKSPLKCVKVVVANTTDECNPKLDRPCYNVKKEALCVKRADNKYHCIDQTATFGAGDQCFNLGVNCDVDGKTVCKVDPTDKSIKTCQPKTQAELCAAAGEYSSWNECHEKNKDDVDNQGAECIVRDDQCYILKKQGERKPITKDKLCSYFHCPNWGTWCEVVDAEKQTARCVWGIGGGGKGDTIPVLQPGQRCVTGECACTILRENIQAPWYCQGSSNGDVCYNPGQKCGKDFKTTCVSGFCKPDK